MRQYSNYQLWTLAPQAPNPNYKYKNIKRNYLHIKKKEELNRRIKTDEPEPTTDNS